MLNSHKVLFIGIALFLIIVCIIFVLTKKSNYKNNVTHEEVQEDIPPLLKNIGVNIDYYNPNIKKAGDFYFTDKKQEYNRIFIDYGFEIPATTIFIFIDS